MIFDLEADGLNPTKIYCLSYTEGSSVETVTSYDEMREVLLSADTLIGHNIIRFDIPVAERILGIKIKSQLIDTLALSWYLNPKRNIHGLDDYGEEFGVPKPKIDDWFGLSIEEYCYRCSKDVKINKKLWNHLKSKLLLLYKDKDSADRLLRYLSFKMECAKEQERVGWKLDKELALKTKQTLEQEEQSKIEQLKKVMPSVKKYVKKTRPKKPFKKDGTYSTIGAKWFHLLKQKGLPEDYLGEIEVFHHEEPPNPASHAQVKDWLFSLGWKPVEFKFEKNFKTGEERHIPQVRVEGENGKELCPSVVKLAEKEPAIKILEGLSVIQHRLPLIKGFLENNINGWLKAEISGLTNTLRFKHKVIVNLPGVSKPWGQEIRGSLIAPEGYILCGSDMTSLEETTKKHFMWEYDPDFVLEMSREGFDAHLDLAKHAGAVSQKEIDDWKAGVDGAKNLKPIRSVYKAANYACIYGVGPPKLSRSVDISQSEAKKLIEAYWERNWSVKQLSEDLYVKEIDGDKWLFNPVSKLYYSLRNEKDRFSTLNQGTGVYCFDRWIKEFFYQVDGFTAQFHDEIILRVPKGEEEKTRKLLKDAIKRTNKKLKLNVTLDIDVQFGNSYAEIH